MLLVKKKEIVGSSVSVPSPEIIDLCQSSSSSQESVTIIDAKPQRAPTPVFDEPFKYFAKKNRHRSSVASLNDFTLKKLKRQKYYVEHEQEIMGYVKACLKRDITLNMSDIALNIAHRLHPPRKPRALADHMSKKLYKQIARLRVSVSRDKNQNIGFKS